MHSITEFGTNIPAFLTKLWKMVEDPSTNDLILWKSNGTSFLIKDQARFARELLPMYYKHNNMASFIRQLNMYGFHKIVSVESGCAKLEQDEAEFQHPCFVKDRPYLLEHIKRKITTTKCNGESNSVVGGRTEVVNKVLTDVRQMRNRQESMDSRLSQMKLENEGLWRELALLRQKHLKQQQIVNKLIQFLVSLVQHPPTNGISVKRRNFPLMLQDRTRRADSPKPSQKTTGVSEMLSSPKGPVIQELDSNEYESLLLDDDSFTCGSHFMSEAVTPETITESLPMDVAESPTEDGDRLMDLPKQFLAKLPAPDEELTPSKPLILSLPKGASKEPNRCLQIISKAKKRRPQKPPHANRKPNGRVERIPVHDISGLDIDGNFPLNIDSVINATDTQTLEDLTGSTLDNIQSTVDLESFAASSAVSSPVGNTRPVTRPSCSTAGLTATAVGTAAQTPSVTISTPKKRESADSPSTSASTKRIKTMLPSKRPTPAIATKESKSPGKNKDMIVACKTPSLSSKSSVNKYSGLQENINISRKSQDVDNQLEVMQSELESLKELLKGEGVSLDANTLLGLFSNEDPLSYTMDLPEDVNKNRENGNELMTYSSPSVGLDFTDMFPDNDWILPDFSEAPSTEDQVEDNFIIPDLETPDISLQNKPPIFSATLKKRT